MDNKFHPLSNADTKEDNYIITTSSPKSIVHSVPTHAKFTPILVTK